MTRTAQRRFSLIEIAISVAVLAILLVGTFSLLVSSQQATLTTANEVNLDFIARDAMRFMREEIRQSGWEVELASSGDLWAGNMVPTPVPSDSSPGSFGTVVDTDGRQEIIFRKRIGFNLGTPEEDHDWTNDGATTPAKRFIRYFRRVDNVMGPFRNVPGGTLTRYRLVRQEGSSETGPWRDVGFQIPHVENVTFWRTNWDTITVKLELMMSHPVGHGRGQPPEPIRRKLTERIQLLNASDNGVRVA